MTARLIRKITAAIVIIASISATAFVAVAEFELTAPRFYIGSGENRADITDLGVGVGRVVCEAKVAPSMANSAVLLAALYKNGDFEAVRLSGTTSYAEGGAVTLATEVTIPSSLTDRYTLKAFLWSGTEDIAPLAKTASLESVAKLFFVSPNGSDSALGTVTAPWKTMRKLTTASAFSAGSTAVFMDGVYRETQAAVFNKSGTAKNPISIRALNKHGAKIVYPSALSTSIKLVVNNNQRHIAVRDFEFTVEDGYESGSLNDIMLCSRGSDSAFTGNKIHGFYEDGIKLSGASGMLIEDNTIYDIEHEGFDAVNTADTTVRNNTIRGIGRMGILVKGGSRNFTVYNNLIYSLPGDTRTMSSGAVGVGGTTIDTSAFDVNADTGFEIYNSAFFNNIIYSQSATDIHTGFAYSGATDTYCFNNIVVGCARGVRFKNAPGTENGWEWDPPCRNNTSMNNLFVSGQRAYDTGLTVPQNLVSDYNL
ncbi:MAG: right-handed parallel beta-helix repeat-containing protein, partial [Clostridiales bacterium]|nr:right-handed parallel beta-helix repeat-containing protein [Clostridiales bacterium]